MSTTGRIEAIWGVSILDEGFTAIPNMVMKNWAKLGIKPGEWALITSIMIFKHDARDAYPSQESLAEILCVDVKQIKRWLKSLKDKGFIKVGRRRHENSKVWGNNVYSLKPLLDAILTHIGEPLLPESNDYEIDWGDEVTKRNPGTQIVPMAPNGQNVPVETAINVPMDKGQNVPIKKNNVKKNNKKQSGKVGEKSPTTITFEDSKSDKEEIKKIDIEKEQTKWVTFKSFCIDRGLDGDQAFQLWKIYLYKFPEAPYTSLIATLREIIDEKFTFKEGKWVETDYKSLEGLFHHRMQHWKGLLAAVTDIEENGGWH